MSLTYHLPSFCGNHSLLANQIFNSGSVGENNEQSIIAVKNSFTCTKARLTGQKTASQITLRDCYRKVWFSAQYSVLSEQRTSNKSGIHSFKVSGSETQRVSMASESGKRVLASKEDQLWCARKGGI